MRKTKLSAIAFVTIVGLAAARVPAGVRVFAQSTPSKLDAALRGASGDTVRVIVGTQAGAADAFAQGLRQKGRSHVKTFGLMNAVAADLRVEDLADFDRDPMVTSVSLDATVTVEAQGGQPTQRSASTLRETLGLSATSLTGRGVGIAVIDSGLDPSSDFSATDVYDFTGERDPSPTDDYGHGTHVSGLIAGTDGRVTFESVAPQAHIVSLKVIDASGRGVTSAVIEAIEFAIVNKDSLGIDLINLSLGHPILEPAATDPLVQAVETAVRAGIVVVVSAGNVGRALSTGEVGYAGILSPGNAPSAITVGAADTKNTATRRDDTVAVYSSRGPTWYDALAKPDLVAPGHELVSTASIGSTLYLQYPERRLAGDASIGFLRLNGTSLSAAITSGVVALMIQASRDTFGSSPTPAAIKAILQYTALPLGGADALMQGHGELNAAGAVSMTLALGAPSALSGVPATSIEPVTTIDGEAWRWAQTFDWGDTVVWGNWTLGWSTTAWGNALAPAWTQALVWGSLGWTDDAVWGSADAVVWGNISARGDTPAWPSANDLR